MDLSISCGKVSNPNGCESKPSATVEPQRSQVAPDKEEHDELNSLLSPRKGGMKKDPKKSRRKVQWNDRNGNKLVEILEFQPSDSSDSDEDSDSCICTIL
ncbi:uncharacterized protein LOC122071452 isoform X2 [Macadamia integrifolia]|uniref:uncharacterized protein LOC122071452 isoform X2 n=1 Tax=Macadamia integrifolia TaxID=60698 RepID=UPI001C4F7DC0|nr:uncharacterized protein LOC122071452 isoform X2 [Macadamia integrifolia]